MYYDFEEEALSLTSQEKVFFAQLTERRTKIADAMEDPSIRGIKRSVIDKYSDQAHFVYELLQNADDAEATSVRFILRDRELLFAHNGNRHFSLTNPKDEAIDGENDTLGDINAITSVANSTKKSSSQIGKFGVGFKAVFQYTDTPIIYDPAFSFRIERLIVPTLLEQDHPSRREGETLFVFPFNKADMPAKTAYDDIESKLEHLVYPILFLPHLERIEYTCGNRHGYYEETIKNVFHKNALTAQFVEFVQQKNEKRAVEHLWLFSRTAKGGHPVAVAFFLSEDGHLTPKAASAFCFFPTKERTGLQFFIHAPFLLTDSREGIRAGSVHNESMVRELAKLAADALLTFVDLGKKENRAYITTDILDMIPYDRWKLEVEDVRAQISFVPFYRQILDLFKTEKILPSNDGNFSFCRDAYWAESTRLPRLFSHRQLQQLTGNPKAAWVFDTLGSHGRQDTKKIDYIRKIVCAPVQETTIFEKLTSAFIREQTQTWLCQFYAYVNEQKTRWNAVKKLPVFLDQEKEPTAAFDAAGREILFLRPEEDDAGDGYRFVYDGLMRHEATKELAGHLLMHEPSLSDEIQNKILPLYQEAGRMFDTRPHIRKFVRYYRECLSRERKSFVEQLKKIAFIYYKDGDGIPHRTLPETAYVRTKELERYFAFSGKSAPLITLKDYNAFVAPVDAGATLQNFLHDLALDSSLPKVVQSAVPRNIAVDLHLTGWKSTKALRPENNARWMEETVDGFQEILSYIETHHDKEAALLAWNMLAAIFRSEFDTTKNEKIFNCICEYDVKGTYTWNYGQISTKYVKPTTHGRLPVRLKGTHWILDKVGKFVEPHQLTRQSMSSDYHLEDGLSDRLLDYLGIVNAPASDLTEEEQRKILLMDKLAQAGFTEEKLKAMLQRELQRKQDAQSLQERSRMQAKLQTPEARPQAASGDVTMPSGDSGAMPQKTTESSQTSPAEPATGKERTSETPRSPSEKHASQASATQKPMTHKERWQAATRATKTLRKLVAKREDTVDNDDDAPKSIDYDAKIRRAKQKNEAELAQISYAEELQERALAAERYSYEWFRTILEMELFQASGGEEQQAVSINFERVKREEGTRRTLVLQHPDRYIPRFMEDLSDLPMTFYVGESTKKVMMEAANVQSYTLRVKLKSESELDGIDPSNVTAVHIEAKSPDFLLEKLYEAFSALSYDDKRDLQHDLCKNISFVFGPPGTGKTTYLADHVLIPKMKATKKYRVLVLAPTNKAADVLTMRMVERMGSDASYKDWLCRFGTTQDEAVETAGIFCDRELDVSRYQRCTVVTTMARFPYDYFLVGDKRLNLRDMDWDFIVVDEASMIPLVQMVYLLYKQHPQNFIIAGDPFQIEPITSVALWRGENIYTMVHLDDFQEAHTVPHAYPITRLTTQYRSIPQIGEIFSKATYHGILKHHRKEGSRRTVSLGDRFDLHPLTIVKFPVSRYESIYRAKRLQGRTPYQIYAALFTFEFSSWLARLIHEGQPEETFKIGIIAPYRAQADLIDKLLAQGEIPRGIDIQAGTIHGFQGDECDIILTVFNPPPKITASPEMFLNKKNIINVAISRARDYLIVVMPDDKTENVEQLGRVKMVEHLMCASEDCRVYAAQDIEQDMFGSRTYIEDNTFSTSHQSVNVYGLPETYYEIRSEDHALDVQIHRENARAKQVSGRRFMLKASDATEDAQRKKMPSKEAAPAFRVQTASDGWDQVEITLLVQFFLRLPQMDSEQMDQATKTFSVALQEYAVRHHPENNRAVDERSYDAVGNRIAGLNFLRMGASAEEVGLPELYAHVYRMSQTYPAAFHSWLNAALKVCPINLLK